MQNLMMDMVVRNITETVEQPVHLFDECNCGLTPAVHVTCK
jgi:hypothetical protein